MQTLKSVLKATLLKELIFGMKHCKLWGLKYKLKPKFKLFITITIVLIFITFISEEWTISLINLKVCSPNLCLFPSDFLIQDLKYTLWFTEYPFYFYFWCSLRTRILVVKMCIKKGFQSIWKRENGRNIDQELFSH